MTMMCQMKLILFNFSCPLLAVRSPPRSAASTWWPSRTPPRSSRSAPPAWPSPSAPRCPWPCPPRLAWSSSSPTGRITTERRIDWPKQQQKEEPQPISPLATHAMANLPSPPSSQALPTKLSQKMKIHSFSLSFSPLSHSAGKSEGAERKRERERIATYVS